MADSRNIPIKPKKTALLIIDMQEYCAIPGKGLFKDVNPKKIPDAHKYMFERLEQTTIPAIRSLLIEFRAHKSESEVIYTFIESLTLDARDQSLDYKLSGFCVPKGSPDAKILDEIQPEPDEILIPKTSCSVFMSTNINYVLRNLGISQLVVTGMVTNQCVESAVRDAADLGYLVTLVEDAVATHTQADHDQSLKNMKGFARICSHKTVLEELKIWQTSQNYSDG